MRRLALCLVLGLGLGCGANGPSPDNERARTPARAEALAADDAANRLRARLAPRLSRSSASLTEVVHPNGRRSLRVNGRFSQAQLARIDGSGRVVTECVDNLPAAERALAAGTP